MKSSGFNIEDTHLTLLDRIERLFAVMIIAFVWVYLVGIYKHLKIIASLTGYYKHDQLYLLKTNYESYVFFTSKLNEIDHQIETLLKEFPLKKEIPL